MKIKSIKILLVVSTVLLFSACSSKDEFYRGTYNWIQDEKFYTNKKEYDYKRLHSHEHTQHQQISYDEYKENMKSDKN